MSSDEQPVDLLQVLNKVYHKFASLLDLDDKLYIRLINSRSKQLMDKDYLLLADVQTDFFNLLESVPTMPLDHGYHQLVQPCLMKIGVDLYSDYMYSGLRLNDQFGSSEQPFDPKTFRVVVEKVDVENTRVFGWFKGPSIPMYFHQETYRTWIRVDPSPYIYLYLNKPFSINRIFGTRTAFLGV